MIIAGMNCTRMVLIFSVIGPWHLSQWPSFVMLMVVFSFGMIRPVLWLYSISCLAPSMASSSVLNAAPPPYDDVLYPGVDCVMLNS